MRGVGRGGGRGRATARMARGARGWLAAVGLAGLAVLAAGARAPAGGPALRLEEAAAPAETLRSRMELVLPEGIAGVAFKDLTVSVIATVNQTTGLALVDDSVNLFAGAWDPEPPEDIATVESGYTPLAFKVSGDDEPGATHVNGTAEYAYVEGKRLGLAFAVVDGAAAIETAWSRGTLAQTFLTLAGSEVICTVIYSDLPEVGEFK